jgi:NDP-sugar pyrophosphorylase family protein
MTKRAVILAGGKGTRLRPYTVVLPKPLMPIGEHPILEVVIRQLVRHKFEHITIAVNHQAELIKAFFGNGCKWNVLIDYSLEDKPLGTMGPLRLISDLPPHFLVMNGDILTDLNYSEFHDTHIAHNRLFSISSHKREHTMDYGVLEVGESRCLSAFFEKPTHAYEVSMGIYMLRRDILNYLPDGVPFGFDNLMAELLRCRQPVHVEQFGGYWLDIGRADDYMQALDEFERCKDQFLNG